MIDKVQHIVTEKSNLISGTRRNMANQLIIPLYKEVFGKDFQNTMDCRIKLQKVVYMLEEQGIVLGNYSFSWYKYGPYSIELQDDIHKQGIQESNSEKFPWIVCNEVREAVEVIKSIVNSQKDSVYSSRYWIEAVASLLFLKKW